MKTEVQKQVEKLKRDATKQGYKELLFRQLNQHGLPHPELEYLFHPARKWRIDFAWPSYKLAFEVEGGVYSQKGGGHRSITGWDANLEKYNELAVFGWYLIRVTPEMLELRNGKAIVLLKRFFEILK